MLNLVQRKMRQNALWRVKIKLDGLSLKKNGLKFESRKINAEMKRY